MVTPVFESGTLPSNWNLVSLDDRTRVEGQYPLRDGVAVSLGSSIPEASRVGFQDPVVQWINGTARTFSFRATFFARHKDEDVKRQLDKLEMLATYDSRYGRNHICIFTYGKVYTEIVLIRNLDPTVGPLRDDGTARNIDFSFQLVRYKPFSQKALDPSAPAKESYLRVASAPEESYEALARAYYGDPMLGDRLRKRHPEMPLAPVVGEVVRIPDASIISTEVVEPAFHALQTSTDEKASEAFRRILTLRASRRVRVA